MRGKHHHLRILACSNEHAVRFGDHKYAVKGQPAAANLGVGKLQTTHRFHRMNVKSGEGNHHYLRVSIKLEGATL